MSLERLYQLEKFRPQQRLRRDHRSGLHFSEHHRNASLQYLIITKGELTSAALSLSPTMTNIFYQNASAGPGSKLRMQIPFPEISP